MRERARNWVGESLLELRRNSSKLAVFVVANIKDVTIVEDDYRGFSVHNDYMTESVIHGILQSLREIGIYVELFIGEDAFIKAVHADPFFTAFPTAREEEAVGIVSGAWMAGMRGAVLMQTSGFGTLPNAIASLAVPSQIPLILFVSERGTLGEFNLGQALVCRTMRPVLDSIGVDHHTITRLDEAEFIVDRTIRQAVGTQVPACLILSPLLTGGKVLS